MWIMLSVLSAIQVVLYVALLALAGQGILFLLAGANREKNFFYGLLKIISKPFTVPVRMLTPSKVGDHQVPIVTFFLLLIAYAVVTFERINLCIGAQMMGCK